MPRMLHSITQRNYFYTLAHFLHCNCTQQIRELLKFKWPRSTAQLVFTKPWNIWKPAKVRIAEVGPALRVWALIFSPISVTQSDAGKGASYISQQWKSWIDSCKSRIKSRGNLRTPSNFPLGDPEHEWPRPSLQEDASSFSLSTSLSIDLWMTLKAGISWGIVLQGTSELALKSRVKKIRTPEWAREG